MKELFRNLVLGATLLFSSANAQFSKDAGPIGVKYKGKSYLVEQYKFNDQKRRYAYEIYINENGQRGEFIGDNPSEFQTYKEISLTSNYFLDRYYIREDLTKIKNLFRKTNQYFIANKLLHGATLELTKFGTEIALMNKFTKEKLVQKVATQYRKRLEEFGKKVAKDVINGFLEGKLKSKRDLERIINSNFHYSIDKAKVIQDSLTVLQEYLRNLSSLNYDEFLNFRGRLYNNLRNGYENQAMQYAWVLSVNKPEVKAAYIGDRILKTGLSTLDGGDHVYKELIKLGVDIEKVDNSLSFYIKNYVNNTLSRLEIELFLEEERFNPANENSLAYKFLRDRNKNIFENFSLKDLIINHYYPDCSNYFINDNKEINFYLKGCDTGGGSSSAVFIRVILPYDFKKFNNNTRITFESEIAKGLAYNCVIALLDNKKRSQKDVVFRNISPTGSDLSRFDKSDWGKLGLNWNKVKWDILLDKKKEIMYTKCFPIENEKFILEENFDIKKFDEWFLRIVPQAWYRIIKGTQLSPNHWTSEGITIENEEVEIKIKNLKIKSE